MKRKHLFASAVMAAVLAGCSQEEIIVNDNLQSLGERPMVEAPVFSFEGVDSRMTTGDSYAKVKWQEGDGFGAAVIDSYYAEGTTWETMFPIQKYISSNVLFKTEDGKNFYADASMPMGNHLFYAPFNVQNISRGPLAVQLPLEQVVVPNADGSHSNTAITAFYEDKTSPVFVAYDSISATPKTTLSDLQMRHIYSLPMITLELGKVHLLNAAGELKNDGSDAKKPVYETELIIDSIAFNADVVSSNNAIVTSGNIDNDKIVAKLEKAVDPITGKEIASQVVWDATAFETNATADLLLDVDAAQSVRDQIVVKFDGGQKVAVGKPAKFVMVLPGAAYAKKDLKVLVYAKINGKAYVSAASSLNFDSRAYVEPARDARLLPGQAYSADEYNANGDPKSSKGTSMTYTIGGKLTEQASDAIGFIPVDKAIISGYTAISSEADLINFVKNVAYRGEELVELTKADAEARLTNDDPVDDPDPKKHFVVTATDEAPVILTDEFVKEFKNACVVAGKNAFVTFLGWDGADYEEKNVVLGDITWNANANNYIKFINQIWAQGTVTFTAAPGRVVRLMSTANVTLDAALNGVMTVANEYNGTINLNSAKAHAIWNDYGTLNVNASTAASLHNGVTTIKPEFEEIEEYVATMTIADGVTATGAIYNRETGVATIGEVIATIANEGKMTTESGAADLTVTGAGEINNTAAARIANTGNVVYANVGTFNLTNSYDDLAGLNKLVVTSTITNSYVNFNGNVINTIDFIDGNGINLLGYLNGTTLDLSTVKKINIKANTTWVGRDASKSFVQVKVGSIVEDEDCILTIKNLTVFNKKIVVEASATPEAKGTALLTAITNAEDGAVITVPKGDFEWGAQQNFDKSITIIGEEGTVIKNKVNRIAKIFVGAGKEVVLKNLTFEGKDAGQGEIWIDGRNDSTGADATGESSTVIMENVTCDILLVDTKSGVGIKTLDVNLIECEVKNQAHLTNGAGTLNFNYDGKSTISNTNFGGMTVAEKSNLKINGIAQ